MKISPPLGLEMHDWQLPAQGLLHTQGKQNPRPTIASLQGWVSLQTSALMSQTQVRPLSLSAPLRLPLFC